MKKTIKVYLEPNVEKALLGRAEQMGIEGRGALSQYLTQISKMPFLILDENVKTMLKALDLK